MTSFQKIGLCVLTGLFVMTGCKTVQEGSSRFTVSDISVSSQQSGITTSFATSSASAEPTPVTGTVNALTGEQTTEVLSRQRPLAVAMNNITYALPQNGISQADLVIESEVFGGITRLLAVYNDWDSLTKVGSIRELTPCLADLAQAMDAIPLHTEPSSTLAASTLKGRGYSTLNANYYKDGVLAYRDETLKATRSLEHTLVSSGALIRGVTDQIGLRTKYREDVPTCWFNFSSTQVIPSEYRCRVIYTNYGMSAYYDYDSTNGVYHRFISGASQTDLNDGSAVTVRNVLLLFAKQTVDETAGTVLVDFSSGEGYYFSLGGGQQIYWQRGRKDTDRLMLYDTEGQELVLNTGSTWITIMPTEKKSGISWTQIGG